MKLRLLLTLVFIITTTLSAMHEIEHINHNHDSSSCLVCIANDNFVSSDVITAFKDVEYFLFTEILPQKSTTNFHTANPLNRNRAPPFKS